MTSLRDLRWHWNEFGKRDPLWAVLTLPNKQGGQWEREEFFALGVREIDAVFSHLGNLDALPEPGSALDFGCGVGRLSQALARRFREVIGVDIAESMVERARDFAAELPNLAFVVNLRPDLARFADGRFDFVISVIVLQHVPPALVLGYLDELLRVAAPGGVVVFQLPSRPRWIATLPAEGRWGSIRILSAPAKLAPGAHAVVVVEVTNASPIAWHHGVDPPLQLGNHWLREDRRIARWEDGRALLPGALAPSESGVVRIAVQAPSVAGRYRLALDLLQEGVSWFGTASEVAVEVAGRSPALGGLNGLSARVATAARWRLAQQKRRIRSLFGRSARVGRAVLRVPGMEMHGVSREQVEEHLARRSITLLDVVEDGWGGDDWESFTYFARKPT